MRTGENINSVSDTDMANDDGRPLDPKIVARRESVGGLELDLQIARDLAWFDGHFPGQPVLPGVVQVHWAIRFGQELGFEPDAFRGLRRVKFKAIIQPPLMIRLSLLRKGTRLAFAFESEQGLHSQGTIEFAELGSADL